TPPPPSWFESMQAWGGRAAEFVSNLTLEQVQAGVANFAGQVVDAVTSTARMARDDPFGFMGTVAQGYLDYNTVVANTLTFGLIPGLHTRSDFLLASNGFYQVVQIGAVIGREVAITARPAGTGTVAAAGARVAGRFAVGMVMRASGPAGVRTALTV